MNDPRKFEGDYNSDDEDLLPEANDDELEQEDEEDLGELGGENVENASEAENLDEEDFNGEGGEDEDEGKA